METPNLMPDAPEGGHAPAHKKSSNLLVIVLVIFLVLAGLAGGYWAYTTYGIPDFFGGDTEEEEEMTDGREMHVQWASASFVGDLGFLPLPEGYDRDNLNPPERDCNDVATHCNFTYYKVGSFVDGPYSGSDLYIVHGLGELGGPPTYRFVDAPAGPVMLSHHSDSYWLRPGETAPFTIDSEYRIPELQFPAFLEVPDRTDMVLRRASATFFYGRSFWSTFDESQLEMLFETEYGPVWTDRVDVVPTPQPEPGAYYRKEFGYYIEGPDGSVVNYSPEFGFVHQDRVFAVWEDGLGSFGEYIWFDFGGCGRSTFTAVVQPHEVSRQELDVAGATESGEPLYVIRNTQHHLLTTQFEFAPEYIKSGPDAYQRYLDLKPIFFYEDAFGRLIRFQAKDLRPAAECAKPVIYLYPEATEWVNVVLEPKGGFLISEPEYRGSWYVQADPTGQLYHPATDANYPYLFWEGHGSYYRTPEKGWVVARGDVSSFLDETLGQLGLQGREIADFKEFWLPLMQESPWYFVTFMGNRAMDEIAPLSISPQPDTVIRVLMDYVELDEPVDVTAPVIRTPERKGFTVIEWGGVRR